jgi:hypothetical protein
MSSRKTKLIEAIVQVDSFIDRLRGVLLEALKTAPVCVDVYRPEDDRSNPQNAKIHALMSDINRQAVIVLPGRRVVMADYPADACKALLVVWFANERALSGRPLPKPPRTITDPISGEAITLRPSTTEFGKKNMCEFVEFLYALGCDSGVRWSEPALREYESYREAK